MAFLAFFFFFFFLCGHIQLPMSSRLQCVQYGCSERSWDGTEKRSAQLNSTGRMMYSTVAGGVQYLLHGVLDEAPLVVERAEDALADLGLLGRGGAPEVVKGDPGTSCRCRSGSHGTWGKKSPSHKSQVTSQVTSHESRVTSHVSRVTRHASASHELRVTSHQGIGPTHLSQISLGVIFSLHGLGLRGCPVLVRPADVDHVMAPDAAEARVHVCAQNACAGGGGQHTGR